MANRNHTSLPNATLCTSQSISFHFHAPASQCVPRKLCSAIRMMTCILRCTESLDQKRRFRDDMLRIPGRGAMPFSAHPPRWYFSDQTSGGNIFQALKTRSSCLRALLSSPKPSFSLGISVGPVAFFVPPGLRLLCLLPLCSLFESEFSVAVDGGAPFIIDPMLGIVFAD
jgi:hypothetical protein